MLGVPIEASPGRPVVVKRLGNVLEANLARARLEAAGIPSFIGSPDAFAGPSERAMPVAIFVPQSLVADALDALALPPPDVADDDWLDDPGRPLAFRALVAAVVGWMAVFFHLVGVGIAVTAFCYAIALATSAVRRSIVGDRGLRLQVAAAVVLSASGLAMSAWLTVALVAT